MLRSVHFLPVLVASIVTSASGQSLEERYWLALNEGRDLAEMHPVVEVLAGPGRQVPANPEVRADGLRLLDRIERTALLNQLAVDSDDTAPYVDADWPSMGGHAAHTGATTQPGPTLGELVWQYPVGWPWQAAAYLFGSLDGDTHDEANEADVSDALCMVGPRSAQESLVALALEPNGRGSGIRLSGISDAVHTHQGSTRLLL